MRDNLEEFARRILPEEILRHFGDGELSGEGSRERPYMVTVGTDGKPEGQFSWFDDFSWTAAYGEEIQQENPDSRETFTRVSVKETMKEQEEWKKEHKNEHLYIYHEIAPREYIRKEVYDKNRGCVSGYNSPWSDGRPQYRCTLWECVYD